MTTEHTEQRASVEIWGGIDGALVAFNLRKTELGKELKSELLEFLSLEIPEIPETDVLFGKHEDSRPERFIEVDAPKELGMIYSLYVDNIPELMTKRAIVITSEGMFRVGLTSRLISDHTMKAMLNWDSLQELEDREYVDFASKAISVIRELAIDMGEPGASRQAEIVSKRTE